jgi:hypothetical protein
LIPAKIQAKSSEKVEVRNSETLSIKCSITQLKTEKEAQSDKIFTSELGVQVSSKLKVSLGFSGLEATNISVVVKHPEVGFSSSRPSCSTQTTTTSKFSKETDRRMFSILSSPLTIESL